MHRILVFGDSNTYGYRPGKGGRYGATKRWPAILATLLGKTAYAVIEDGANGRTAVYPDPDGYYSTGLADVEGAIRAAAPLDLFILMLGSNDLRKSYAATPAQIGQDVQLVVRRGLCAHPAPPPGVLLLSPPPLLPAAVDGEFYDSTAPARCAELPAVYARIAAACGWAFEDAARYALPSELDGTHLDERGHSALANALLPVVRALCNVRP